MNRHAGATNRTSEYEPNERAADDDDPLSASDERAEDIRERGKDLPLCPHHPHPPTPPRLHGAQCFLPRRERHSRRQGQRVKVEAVRLDDVSTGTGTGTGTRRQLLKVVGSSGSGSGGGSGSGSIILALDGDRRVRQRRIVDPVHVLLECAREGDLQHIPGAIALVLRDVDANPRSCVRIWIFIWGGPVAVLKLVGLVEGCGRFRSGEHA